MGIRNLPDIFKQKINDLLQGFEYIRAYISCRIMQLIVLKLEEIGIQ